jgi:hypothetical protein
MLTSFYKFMKIKYLQLSTSIFLNFLFLSGLSATVFAITIRHDREDNKYLALGAKFPAVCALGRSGDGTLIAPQWILTAAHVANGFQKRNASGTVRFGESEYQVEEIFVHPQWTEMGPHDIALLKLSKPVKDVTPINIFFKTDEAEQVATIVGHGDTRNGNGGNWISDSQIRAATSKIERADRNWIYLTFDSPPAGTDLEGAPGRGDSGGPAIVFAGGKALVAGVSSLGTDGINGPGTYGAEDSFVRVSAYHEWISKVLTGKQKGMPISSKSSEPAAQKNTDNLPANSGQLPDTITGKVVSAFIKAFNSGSEQSMREFYTTNLSDEAVKRRPVDDRLEGYRQMFNNLGAMDLKQVLKAGGNSISILVKREKGEWQRFEFEFSSQAPGKLSGFFNQTVESPGK